MEGLVRTLVFADGNELPHRIIVSGISCAGSNSTFEPQSWTKALECHSWETNARGRVSYVCLFTSLLLLPVDLLALDVNTLRVKIV